MTTFRIILSIVVAEKLHLEQLDVKIIFLQMDLKEKIFITLPKGFKIQGKGNLV